MNNRSFDSLARSERHLTATLLTHLLMCNDFTGLKALFETLGIMPTGETKSDDFEVVSELDPLRDSRIGNPKVRKLFDKHGRVAVPDLFLRWGNQALVLEAKFFTEPPKKELASQLEAQERAIDFALEHKVDYKSCHFTYALLTVKQITVMPEKVETNKKLLGETLTWSTVIDTLEERFGDDAAPDVAYCLGKLKSAEKRARKELKQKADWKTIKDIKTLIANLQEYIERNLIYVGFTGGERALRQASLEELEERHHYKLTEPPAPSRDWLRVDVVVDHYIKLKLEENQYAEGDFTE